MTTRDLLALVEVVAPRFRVLEGCVIRDRPGVEDTFAGWWAHIPGETTSVEAVMNHVHLYDLVDDTVDEADLPLLEAAAERIAEAWRLALADQLPDRELVVTVATEPDEYGPTVTCTQAVTTG